MLKVIVIFGIESQRMPAKLVKFSFVPLHFFLNLCTHIYKFSMFCTNQNRETFLKSRICFFGLRWSTALWNISMFGSLSILNKLWGLLLQYTNNYFYLVQFAVSFVSHSHHLSIIIPMIKLCNSEVCTIPAPTLW